MVGVGVLWIYAFVVASMPLIRCLVDVELRHVTEFRRRYAVYLVAQFILIAAASVVVVLSVADTLYRGIKSVYEQFNFRAIATTEKDGVCRCIVGLVVSAALWTPVVAVQLAGCQRTSETQAIIYILTRQVSPLIGLSAGVLVPVIYRCRCPLRPGCRANRADTTFSIS